MCVGISFHTLIIHCTLQILAPLNILPHPARGTLDLIFSNGLFSILPPNGHINTFVFIFPRKIPFGLLLFYTSRCMIEIHTDHICVPLRHADPLSSWQPQLIFKHLLQKAYMTCISVIQHPGHKGEPMLWTQLQRVFNDADVTSTDKMVLTFSLGWWTILLPSSSLKRV